MTCVDAFKNVSISREGGELRIAPCCIAESRPVQSLDFYHDPYLVNIRSQWQSGTWPSACIRCQQAESSNQSSRRINSNQWYTDHNIHNTDVELLRLDYWTGDTCNLACVMCGPWASSAWKSELRLPLIERRHNSNDYWQQLPLDGLKYVHFHGGEPLLNKQHKQFLAAIPNPHQVHIYYNTNATVRAESDLLEIWAEFGLVQIDFSIDDIGPRFNYIRYPAQWNQVCDNLEWYKHTVSNNCMFAVTTVVSVLNRRYQDDLKNWLATNFTQSRFQDPVEHRLQDCEGVLDYRSVTPDTVKYLDSLDQRRGTNWRELFPLAQQDLLC